MKTDIAICITTRNRREAFYTCYQHQFRHHPDKVRLYVVDDASAPLYCHGYDYRFRERAGIPRAKNKCLELAMASGAEHIFLFDDDCYPIAKDWHLPYVNSPYKHLCYTFYQESGGLHHTFHRLGNGCMMYFHRSVIETIGGFDTRFGMGKFEHPHISYRAHAAELIPHPFIDVVGSDKLLYCLDQDNAVERTMPPDERNALINQNRRHYYETRHSTEFIPYI